jgi:lipopolysaccharide biosynthesis regulator YciM
MAIAYNNVGAQNIMAEGNLDKAESTFLKGLELKEELKESQGISYSLHSLAELYNKKKDYAKAKPIAERILKINETTKDKKLQIFALVDLGEVNLNLKDTVEAEKILFKSIRTFKRI